MRTYPLRLNLTTAPAEEPVAREDAKAFLRVDGSADDALIDAMIRAAREACENYTGRALILQEWSMFLDCWPTDKRNDWWDGVRPGAYVGDHSRYISIPKAPLISVDLVNIYADDDSMTEWTESNYFVDTASEPGRLTIRQGGTVPLPTRLANGIEIQFTAGYGNGASDIPTPLIEGIKRFIMYLYENRGCSYEEAAASSGACILWQPYRIMSLLA